MREKVFNTEIKNSLKALGFYAYKIPDMPTSYFGDVKQMRFNVAKPCDIFAAIYDKFVAIEGKMLREYKAFGIKYMRDIQIKNLDELEKTYDIPTFLFLNIRQTKPGQKRLNRLLIFSWSEFRSREVWLKDDLLKRIFWEGKKGIFDLDYFLAHFERC